MTSQVKNLLQSTLIANLIIIIMIMKYISKSLSCFPDFTAILLDVMGNSTSYLQELFKSNSILSGKAPTIITYTFLDVISYGTSVCLTINVL